MVLDTHTDIMLVVTPSAQNLQNNPKTPLISGSGARLGRGNVVGNLQNAIITTSSISGDKYSTASALSPFKHRIVSTNPNFEFNNFVTNFQETTKMNRKNNKAFKKDVLEVDCSQDRVGYFQHITQIKKRWSL